MNVFVKKENRRNAISLERWCVETGFCRWTIPDSAIWVALWNYN